MLLQHTKPSTTRFNEYISITIVYKATKLFFETRREGRSLIENHAGNSFVVVVKNFYYKQKCGNYSDMIEDMHSMNLAVI